MATYSYDIASIHAKNPELPAVLGDINLNQTIMEGQAFDQQYLRDGKATAAALRALKDMNLPQYAGLTEEIVESAEQRAALLKIVHAQIEYTPATMTDILQDIRQKLDTLPAMQQQLNALPAMQQQLRDLDAKEELGQAKTENALIRLRNRFIFPGQIGPVQKTVPGSGLQLARARAPDQASRDAISLFANNNPALANADIGSSPLFFNATIDNYQHVDCLKLIFFYNESMGIMAGSGLGERKEAIRNWLNTF